MAKKLISLGMDDDIIMKAIGLANHKITELKSTSQP